jgi:hypothetical protein
MTLVTASRALGLVLQKGRGKAIGEGIGLDLQPPQIDLRGRKICMPKQRLDPRSSTTIDSWFAFAVEYGVVQRTW